MKQTLVKYQTQLLAVVVLVSTFILAQPPTLSQAEQADLSQSFGFEQQPLAPLAGHPQRFIRPVNPSLAHIDAWISSVGAAIALNDLDNDGLSNDICYVDTRIDQVVVQPAQASNARYRAFALDPNSLKYDASTTAPMGCLPSDINEDGMLDLIVYYWGRTPIIFVQQYQGANVDLSSQSYVAQELVTTDERWFTNTGLVSDFDGDGHQDLLFANYFPDGAAILDAKSSRKQTMQASMSRAFNGGDKHFFLWQQTSAGQAPFVAVPDVLSGELNHGWTLALGTYDFNNDLLPELYIGNDFGPDRFLINRSTPGTIKLELAEGSGGFTIPTSKVIGHDSFKGMGVDFSDINSDQHPDIFVSNITTPFGLHESNFAYVSDPSAKLDQSELPDYTDQSEHLGFGRSGWAWDIKLADFNNDQRDEILQATGFVKGTINRWPELQELATGNDQLLADPASWPRFSAGDDIAGHQINPFFSQAADGRYYDLAKTLGFAPTVSRGIAVGDVDGDGKLDFASANQWEDSIFYHNMSQSSNQALGLRLRIANDGKASNLTGFQPTSAAVPAIGAHVTVKLPDGRTLTSQVDGGNGHSGKRSYDLHFGLGALDQQTQLEVTLRWRGLDGSVQTSVVQLTPGNHTLILGQ